jgi:hypothetical protein
MRWTLLTLLLATAPAAASGQVSPKTSQSLPREIRREVVTRWNAPNGSGVRAADKLELEAGRDVSGDVLVLRGPLVIGGHVTGNVLAVNADVTLRATARVDGNVLIVGGQLDRSASAHVDGSIRIYRQSLALREEGDKIAALDDDIPDEDSWWRRLEQRTRGDSRSEFLRIVQAGPYNRAEGLPIELGPLVQRPTPWGSVRFNTAAMLRTATSFSSERSDVGQRLRGEVSFGHDHGIGIGAGAYNIVDGVETWQLSDLETALAAFVSRRDYRDYFARHGANAYLTAFGAHDLNVSGAFAVERWSSRVARNPFSILNGEHPWRDNPSMDEGLFHIATLRASLDTRTDPVDPWSGWFASADVEHGAGTETSIAPTSAPRLNPPGPVTYTRAFLDLRRYNRLSPAEQLNMRVVVGGWVGGDPLPLERRLSVDGPGALPGFDFRSGRAGPDVGTCNDPPVLPSRPAECDRILLTQIEYRGDLPLDIFSNWEDWPFRYRGAHGDATWVLFTDAGRGWKVGRPDGSITYSRGALPPLSTFRADLGLGLDVSGIGIYAAKSVSTPAEPINYFVRLRHRF